jgi:hypothetical protein
MRWLREVRKLAPVGLALAAGCAGEERQITPTTLGTDFRTIPRGQMRPYPWPGSDLSRATPDEGRSTLDPETAPASGPSEAH